VRAHFAAFLQTPSRETFLRVREAVITHEAYQPYGDDLNAMGAQVESGAYAQVLETFNRNAMNLLLSPSAHMYASMAYAKTGREREAEMEKFIFGRVVEGILSTGDGSQERPYVVTRVSDEYDLAAWLGKAVQSQSLVTAEGRTLDLLSLADGELAFDISDCISKLS